MCLDEVLPHEGRYTVSTVGDGSTETSVKPKTPTTSDRWLICRLREGQSSSRKTKPVYQLKNKKYWERWGKEVKIIKSTPEFTRRSVATTRQRDWVFWYNRKPVSRTYQDFDTTTRSPNLPPGLSGRNEHDRRVSSNWTHRLTHGTLSIGRRKVKYLPKQRRLP